MAVIKKRQCDSCERISNAKIVVSEIRMTDDAGNRYSVDLCHRCFGELKDEYGVAAIATTPRRQFEVVNLEDIEIRD
jgi:hypothetical protein